MSHKALELSLIATLASAVGEAISRRARTGSYRYPVTLGLLIICGLGLFGCAVHRPKQQARHSADIRAVPAGGQELRGRAVSPAEVVASEPCWSPEGSMIAFRVGKTTGAASTGLVMQAAGFMIIEAATGKVLGQAPGTAFDWCGENALLWQNGNTQRMDVRTGLSHPSRIEGIGPICSANGRKIALQRDGSRRWVLVIVDQSGARTAVVARGTEELESFTYEWSPSARYLAVADWKPDGVLPRRDWVRIFTAKGQVVRAVPRSIRTTSAGHLVSWTPDESEVVYGCRTRAGCAVCALPLDDTRPPRVLIRTPERDIWGVRTSPNGRWLTYCAGSPPVEDLRPRYGRIYLFNLSTRQVSAHTQDPEKDTSGYGAVWSPDSGQLAYAAKGVIYVATVRVPGRSP